MFGPREVRPRLALVLHGDFCERQGVRDNEATLLCCVSTDGTGWGWGGPNIRLRLKRAGLWDLIPVALAQQILWAPESHRPPWLEAS